MHDNYMVALLTFGNWSVRLANIYMPHDNRSRYILVEYSQILGELQASLDDLPTKNILCIGDFNADPSRGRLWLNVVDFCESNEFNVADMILPVDTFTYLSPSHNTTSWIDHVLCSGDIILSDIGVKYNLAIFDHFPLSINLKLNIDINCDDSYNVNKDKLIKSFIDWKFFDCGEYVYKAELALCDLNICDKIGCTIDHCDEINKNYNLIVGALKEASENFAFVTESKFTPVTGWNSYCRDKYHSARNALRDWIAEGKMRIGDNFDKMKETRKLFVNALNYCRKNKEKIGDEILAKKFKSKHGKEFWNEVKKRRPDNKTNVNEIDGLKENDKIASLFHDKFKAVTGTCDTGDNLNYVFKPNVHFSKRLSTRAIKDAICNIKTGVGFDGIHSNHLKFSSPIMIFIFSKFINSCLIHNYVPPVMLAGVIRPCIKSKSGNLRSSINYREVMISCNFFKLLEYCLLPSIKGIKLSPCQFGYRPDTSTMLANALLKETILNNIGGNRSVFSCFLDLSKAFERVQHKFLLQILNDRKLPHHIVNIFSSIFSNSTAQVYFNGSFSNIWNITRGVRQGGIMSAFLFNVYIDDILRSISDLKVGCFFRYKSG
jgi:hypothetical protein